METVKERLLQFLKAERISKAEFARKLGMSEAYVSTMRKSLPEARVAKLIELYPKLNRDWLLYGEGEMYLPADDKNRDEQKCSGHFVPLLPVEAYAGSLQAYSRGIDPRECELLPISIEGADLAIPISGDSMEPVIHNGVIAILARINERAFIPWGNPLVIDTENGVYLKVVRPSEKGDDYIEACSYNSQYPPFHIPTESIFGIYRIISYYYPVTTM
ncbi:MAG: hypothetical protein K2J63_01495 [Muribaculaceae bacterium]|nr:hypothetical protein [Muribaculaceae bacterium]